MVNEGATGAILVSSGEFTRAAIDAAQRHGHVKLIDGAALRTMLGPLPEPISPTPTPTARPAPTHLPAERSQANYGLWLIALLCAVAYAFIVRAILERTADTAVESQVETARPSVQPTIIVYAPRPVDAAPEVNPAPRPQTEAEIRELQRKADEAIRVIEDSTPEM
jgi:hypothetical protein